MKIRLLVLFLLLTAIAHADAISVDFVASPDVLPAYIAPGVPWVGAFFHATITNLTDQAVYLSSLGDPITAGGHVCFPNFLFTSQCNADNEFPLAPLGTAFYSNFGVFGAGNPPGIYTFTLDVFGGFSGANDHTLLGSDTATVTIVPEPSTLMLLATGLVGVAAKARRKLFQP